MKFKSFLSLLTIFTLIYQSADCATLQSLIHTSAAAPHHGNERQIQPGTPMTLTATVKNVGDEKNAPGEIYIRYAFPKPLHEHEQSLIFQTETQNLPSLNPGEEVAITFSKTHSWPSLFDFIRHDWAMRHYEAVVKIGETEEITGTLPITFSALYYEGPARTTPVAVPSDSF